MNLFPLTSQYACVFSYNLLMLAEIFESEDNMKQEEGGVGYLLILSNKDISFAVRWLWRQSHIY